MQRRLHHFAAFLLAFATLLSANITETHADEADEARNKVRIRRPRNPLDGQPAVRHRKLLLNGRFEFAPTFVTSINADYKHTLGAGLKLEYHFSDSISLGVNGSFNSSLTTALTDSIASSLPDTDPGAGDPTPTRQEFEQHLNDIQLLGAGYLSWTPMYGKMAAFGGLFLPFDIYMQGGVAFAQLADNCDSTVCNDTKPLGTDTEPPDRNPNNDPPLNGGTKLGLYLGVGMHVFLTDYIALDLSFRDYLFSDNPSGLDFDYDFAVTEDDARTLNHFFTGVGLSIMFPFTPKRTE